MKLTTEDLKRIIREELRFLKEGKDLADFVEGDTLRLWHYTSPRPFSKEDDSTMLVDPKYFTMRKHRGSYSRREYERSPYPRSFFYTDLGNIEDALMSGKKLYAVDVPASSVYDFKNDQHLEDYYAKPEFRPYGTYLDWTALFEAVVADGWKGMYYTLGDGGPPVVVYFEPLLATKVESQ